MVKTEKQNNPPCFKLCTNVTFETNNVKYIFYTNKMMDKGGELGRNPNRLIKTTAVEKQQIHRIIHKSIFKEILNSVSGS